MSEFDVPPPRRAALAAFGAALLWLLAAAVVVGIAVQNGFRIAPFDLIVMATLAAGIAAPAAALLLLALVLQGGNRAEIKAIAVRYATVSENGAAMLQTMTDVDAVLGAVQARIEALRGDIGDQAGALGAHASRLEAAAATLGGSAGAAQGAADRLLATLPEAQTQIESIGSLLAGTATQASRQLDDVETLLAGLWTRSDDAQAQAETAISNLSGLLAGIDSVAERTGAAIAARRTELGASIDALFERTTESLDATRDGVHAHTNALLASVEQARVALDHIGGEAARAIGGRLDRLHTTATQFGTLMGEQDVRSRQLVDTIERSFVMLDGKLQHSANMGQTTLDGLATRIGDLRTAIDAMGVPIVSTQGAVQTLAGDVSGLGAAAAAVVETLGSTLPAQHIELTRLSDALDDLTARAAALAAPVREGHAAVDSAAQGFVMQREAMATGAATLATQIEAMRGDLAAVEAQAQGSALSATQALIETLGRVRELADASTGAMRTTITGLIAEAETALDRAGTNKVESAFGAPIRAQLAAIGEASADAARAAQGAADQVTQRLLGLTQTVATVEARIDQAQRQIDTQSRVDLAAQSALLLDTLTNASVDVSKRLSLDVGDKAWAAYLRGDKSIFARRAVTLLDSGSAKRIAKLYADDAEARASITHYVSTFEAMLQRVLGEPDGKALAVTLVSSDIGKLYVALAQAVERLN